MEEDSYLHGIYGLTFGEFVAIYRKELNENYIKGDGLDEFADFALIEYKNYLKTSPEPDFTTPDEENHFDEDLY